MGPRGAAAAAVMSDRSDWCTQSRIQELAKQADTNLTLDTEAQQVLQDIAEDFVENVAAFACELVKHRAGETLELKVIKKSTTTDVHRQRSQLVRRSQTR